MLKKKHAFFATVLFNIVSSVRHHHKMCAKSCATNLVQGSNTHETDTRECMNSPEYKHKNNGNRVCPHSPTTSARSSQFFADFQTTKSAAHLRTTSSYFSVRNGWPCWEVDVCTELTVGPGQFNILEALLTIQTVQYLYRVAVNGSHNYDSCVLPSVCISHRTGFERKTRQMRWDVGINVCC